MTTTTKVGGEVDAYCTKCELLLAHTVLAMVGTKIVRVKCNTCNGEHMYRGKSAPVPKPTAARAARAAAAKVEKVTLGFQEQLATRDLSRAKKYSVKETFAVEDVVDHPTFGLGIVSGVRGDKVDIVFKTEAKILIHGRGEGGIGARPSFSAPKALVLGTADKPPADDQAPSGN
jgi:hypothetical protein